MMHNNENIGERLLTELNAPYVDTYEYIKNGNQIFTHSLSLLIDYYGRFAKGPTSGIKNNTIKLLFIRCINDLVVGFHLAYHAYVAQYYSVTRPIFETLDLIELFQKDEKMAELWSNDAEKFKNSYQPWRIRQILRGDSSDPIYSWFCQLGSHPTFMGLKSNAYMIKSEVNERTTLMITLGSTNLFVPAILPFAFSHILLLKISISMVEYFGKDSLMDSKIFIKKIIENQKGFFEKCIIAGFASQKEDVAPFQDLIDQTDSMIKTLLNKNDWTPS